MIPACDRGLAATASALSVAALMFFSACNVSRDMTATARTPLEQLLLTQSLERSLDEIVLPIPAGASLTVEAAGLSQDTEYARQVVAEWLRGKGYQILPLLPPQCRVGPEATVFCAEPTAPAYQIAVVLQAFGTEQSTVFVGVPPIQSLLIPFSTPELTLYSANRQRGYARMIMHVVDGQTGRIVAAPSSEAIVYFNRYTLLFVITLDRTDLMPPPM